jgi:PST family polysaccharide transporter
MLKKIFESTLIMGASSILVMSLDLIRVKITAVLLGPLGVGTLSVLNHFHSLAIIFLGLGLGTGITKYLASFRGEKYYEYQKKIISNSFQIMLVVSFSGLIITCFLKKFLSFQIFGNESFTAYIVIFAISFPLIVYPNVANSLLQSHKKIRELAIINVLRSLISLIIIIPAVYFFRLEGAIFSAIIIAAVHLVLSRYYVKKVTTLSIIDKWLKFDKSILKDLFKYGVTSLIVGTAYYLSHLILKIIIVSSLGLKINGIYQPVWALTMTYLTIVLSSMSAYSYPRLCELRNNDEINDELNGIIRVAFLIIMPIMFFILIARSPIIFLLYSADFLDATIYMPIQIIGDFFKLLVWALGMYLLPMKRLYAFIVINIIIDIMLVVLAHFLINIYDLHGITISFTFSHLLGFVILFGYSKKILKFKFWPINRLLVLTSFAALIIIIASENFLSFEFFLMCSVLIISLWTYLCVQKKEVNQLKYYLKSEYLKISKKLNKYENLPNF